MARQGWGVSIATAIGVAAGAGAAQLGFGYGLGVITWTPTDAGATDTAWADGLAWATWLAASSTVLGAVCAQRLHQREHPGKADAADGVAGHEARSSTIGRRSTRARSTGLHRPPTPPGPEAADTPPPVADAVHDRGGLLRRVALALGAGLGGLVTVLLIAVPARVATGADTGAPQRTAAVQATLGILIGVLVAIWALRSRAAAVNVTATAAWLWLLAVVSVIDGVRVGRGLTGAQLGTWQFDPDHARYWIGDQLYWPGALLALVPALLIGVLAARRCRPLGRAPRGRGGLRRGGPGARRARLPDHPAALVDAGPRAAVHPTDRPVRGDRRDRRLGAGRPPRRAEPNGTARPNTAPLGRAERGADVDTVADPAPVRRDRRRRRSTAHSASTGRRPQPPTAGTAARRRRADARTADAPDGLAAGRRHRRTAGSRPRVRTRTSRIRPVVPPKQQRQRIRPPPAGAPAQPAATTRPTDRLTPVRPVDHEVVATPLGVSWQQLHDRRVRGAGGVWVRSDWPGVDGFVGALEFGVALDHVVQRGRPVHAVAPLGRPDRLGLPDGAVAAGTAALLDDAEQPVPLRPGRHRTGPARRRPWAAGASSTSSVTGTSPSRGPVQHGVDARRAAAWKFSSAELKVS